MIVTEPYEELAERLQNESEEGFFHTAAQIVLVQGDETVLDLAVGRTHLHEPFTAETLSALYCTAKPVVAVGVLRLIAEDELSLDDRLGDVIDELDAGWIADRTVEQVLGHTAGLHTVNTILARILPERSRPAWVDASPPPDAWRFGIDRAYSEFGGWFLLGRIIESLGEEPFDRWLTANVLEPYGVDTDQLVLRLEGERYDELVPRISATLDLTMDRPVPLLAEVGRETAAEWNPAFGAYGTMRAMADFYRGLLGDLAGDDRVLPAELLGRATTVRLPIAHDVTLDRDAGFGLGFMTPLSSHHFGSAPSDAAFGHAGQGGTSFAWADPERDLSAAVLFNAGLDADTALSFRRVHLVDAIYRGLPD